MRRARISRLVSAFGLACASVLTACSSEDRSANDDPGFILAFDTARVRLITSTDTLRLVVELAVKPEQHSLGLMERRRLPDSAGMLFLYSRMQSDSDAFWMYRTRIPLDIAFIDSVGRIRTMRRMEPCQAVLAEGCPMYAAGARFQAALEVNAGYFRRHLVQLGDRVVLGDTSERLTRAAR
jgi:uncharacterized membrane protein (UPF0127 family)